MSYAMPRADDDVCLLMLPLERSRATPARHAEH